jgi:hypothetical protein
MLVSKNIKYTIQSYLLRHVYFFTFMLILTSCSTIRNFLERKEKQKTKDSFHIYLLLGQSNMAGRSEIESIDTVVYHRVKVLNQDTNWVVAKNPLHFDKPKYVGTGLGLTFGIQMAKQDSNITIGLIPCAKGGTSINEWKNKSFHKETESYPYNDAILRIKKGMNKGVIKGVLWHQGESDCSKKEDIEMYEQKFLAFKDNLEKDLGLMNIPLIIGEIGYFTYEKYPLAQDLNKIFEKISTSKSLIGIVKSDSLNHNGDKIHFNSASYRLLGLRYANEMIKLQQKVKLYKRNKANRNYQVHQ